MSDFLLELAKNPQARRFIESLGLPISLPEELRRARGAWDGAPARGHEGRRLLRRHGRAPAADRPHRDPRRCQRARRRRRSGLAAFRGPAEAYARKAQAVAVSASRPEGVRARALDRRRDGLRLAGRPARRSTISLHPWARSARQERARRGAGPRARREGCRVAAAARARARRLRAQPWRRRSGAAARPRT